MEPPSDYVPKVTKSLLECPKNPSYTQAAYPVADFVHFDDSDTLLFIHEGSLYISLNNGESCKAITYLGKEIQSIDKDPFHKGRAFARSAGGKIHVTQSEGRYWEEINIPKASNECIECWRIYSLAYYRQRLLFQIQTKTFQTRLKMDAEDRVYEKRVESEASFIIYASEDGGQSLRRISAPTDHHGAAPISEYYDGCFASFMDDISYTDGMFYIYRATYTKTPLAAQDTKYALFHSKDFGKSTKAFEELNGYSVEKIFPFSSRTMVLATEDKHHEKIRKLLMYNGEAFEPIGLPSQVISLEDAWYFDEDVRERSSLSLIVRCTRCEGYRLLKLNVSTLRFSWGPAVPCKDKPEYFGQLGSLMGIFWVKSHAVPEDLEKTSLGTRVCTTKASFDYGETWKNLRVRDPSGKHEHLFEGDIKNVEEFSFQESVKNIHDIYVYGKEPTAGILMKMGTVGKNDKNSSRNDMTFISRNGGVSWDVAFEFPVYAGFLDFGNIIIAMPWENSGIYNKFYFSLDQGRIWNEYRFDESIPADIIRIYSFKLKATINLEKRKEKFTEYVFYSLDFSNIFGGVPGTKDDVETWLLPGGKCANGMVYGFDRRKPDAKCLIRKDPRYQIIEGVTEYR